MDILHTCALLQNRELVCGASLLHAPFFFLLPVVPRKVPFNTPGPGCVALFVPPVIPPIFSTPLSLGRLTCAHIHSDWIPLPLAQLCAFQLGRPPDPTGNMAPAPSKNTYPMFLWPASAHPRLVNGSVLNLHCWSSVYADCFGFYFNMFYCFFFSPCDSILTNCPRRGIPRVLLLMESAPFLHVLLYCVACCFHCVLILCRFLGVRLHILSPPAHHGLP